MKLVITKEMRCPHLPDATLRAFFFSLSLFSSVNFRRVRKVQKNHERSTAIYLSLCSARLHVRPHRHRSGMWYAVYYNSESPKIKIKSKSTKHAIEIVIKTIEMKSQIDFEPQLATDARVTETERERRREKGDVLKQKAEEEEGKTAKS